MSWICCFCGGAILPDSLAPLSLMVTQLDAETDAPAQAFDAHGACLAERLAPGVPFDADAFAD